MAEIAPIQVRWFADYHAINPSWGVFHVSLDDGNYDTGAQELDDFRRGEATPEVLAMIEWFNSLGPEDRESLARRVRALEQKRRQDKPTNRTAPPPAPPAPEVWAATAADRADLALSRLGARTRQALEWLRAMPDLATAYRPEVP